MLEQISSLILTQGVLGAVAVVEALVIRQLYKDLAAARDETARVLEEASDLLERERAGKG